MRARARTHARTRRPEEDIVLPEARVRDGCELPSVARDRTWVLWNKSMRDSLTTSLALLYVYFWHWVQNLKSRACWART